MHDQSATIHILPPLLTFVAGVTWFYFAGSGMRAFWRGWRLALFEVHPWSATVRSWVTTGWRIAASLIVCALWRWAMERLGHFV